MGWSKVPCWWGSSLPGNQALDALVVGQGAELFACALARSRPSGRA
jgi:hypothetical protein